MGMHLISGRAKVPWCYIFRFPFATAICETDWLQCQWNGIWREKSIALKELLPIVLATATWGPKWAKSKVLARCDNMAVVEILKTCTSKNPSIMHLLCCLHFFTAKWDIRLEVEHIPGLANTVADAILRNFMQVFRREAPQANTTPIPILPSLWELVVSVQPDWTSPTWREKLAAFLTKVSPNQQLTHTEREQ